MAATDTNEFDQHLENEFSRLGFSYPDIKANGSNSREKDKSEMFVIDYLDDPFMLADGLAVIFTIINPVGGKLPVIEAMSATLFNDSCYGKLTSLVEKKYSFEVKELPVKDQILAEMKEMLTIKNVKVKFGTTEDSTNPDLKAGSSKRI